MAQDWMPFYFINPQPERFVAEVRALAAAGALSQGERSFPTSVFLSRLIAAHPDQIAAWFSAFGDLTPDDLHSLALALWLADVPEAKALLAQHSHNPLFAQAPPNVLEMEINHPLVLDALWAYYFATGELMAVRRVITALEFMNDYGAAAAFSQSAQTEADKMRALHDGIFQAAAWSLSSSMQQHPPLKEYCSALVRTSLLTPNERCALAIELQRLEPEVWRVDIHPQTNVASISWREGGPLA